MNWEQAYWYARGYHDGRVVGAGVEEGLDAIGDDADRDANRVAYRQGYDLGVADYCDLDKRSEGEAA